MQTIPKTGLKGLIENWQSDLISAISVALVAMPLGLGIAIASGVDPIVGILSAIIGGVVTTFFRGSHLAINGPAAGLIAVVLNASFVLNDGSGNTFNYVLAAIVVSGAIQVILGLLKLGKYANIFHSTVIHGVLAAIGVIIIGKQIHITMGLETDIKDTIPTLIDAVKQIPHTNPFVFLISITGLLLLIFQSRISYKIFHLIPAPVWLLLLAIPFVFLFNFFDSHSIEFLGNAFEVGPNLLIDLPDNPLDVIMHPDFSKAHTLPFWTSVLSITLVSSMLSLAGTKAVDKLDPYRRRSDLNKDLVGIGISTMVSGALGGLPIITVIVRSSVNVHNNAKTRWSNLYHGIILILFLFILTPVIRMVPLCALATLLVFTGFKLTSPKVFRHMYSHGPEQLIFFIGTLVLTITYGLLMGIFGGLALTLLVHWLLSMVSPQEFYKMIFKSNSHYFKNKDGSYSLNIKGVSNFLATLKIDTLLAKIQSGSKVTVDLSDAKLVDFSILEDIYEFQRSHTDSGGSVSIIGLEHHNSSCNHKLALKILPQKGLTKLDRRQLHLAELSSEHIWNFNPRQTYNLEFLASFYFFKPRPIEFRENTITPQGNNNWEICDITFTEGAFAAADEYQTTICLINSPSPLPTFVIEKKTITDIYFRHKDIDYEIYSNFSKDFIVKVENIEKANSFFTPELKKLIENSNFTHLESNGESIMIFDANFRLTRISDYSELVGFAEEMETLIG